MITQTMYQCLCTRIYLKRPYYSRQGVYSIFQRYHDGKLTSQGILIYRCDDVAILLRHKNLFLFANRAAPAFTFLFLELDVCCSFELCIFDKTFAPPRTPMLKKKTSTQINIDCFTFVQHTCDISANIYVYMSVNYTALLNVSIHSKNSDDYLYTQVHTNIRITDMNEGLYTKYS